MAQDSVAISWLESWCETVPGLIKTEDGYWVLQSEAAISYPPGGHASMAEIEEKSYWFHHRNSVISSVVARYAPPGAFLDIGGGNGFVSLGLLSEGHYPVVVEPGSVGAANCKARGLAVINAPYEELQIPDASIPAAGLFDVIEHISDDRAALTGVRNALLPGGWLFVAVPAYSFLWSDADIAAGHFRRYSRSKLVRLLEEVGFEVAYSSYFFAALVPALATFRSLPYLLGKKGKSEQEEDHRLPGNIIGTALRKSLLAEERRIKRGKSVPLGTSVIVAARKPHAA